MKHQLKLGVRTWLHLNRIMYTVGRRLSGHLEHYDLTLAQFGVLAHLQAAPHISQQALADWLSVTKGNIVGLLNRLEDRGLVERRPDPADRRRTIVQVIPGQATLIGHWLDGAARPLARVLDKLTPDEQETFLKAMDLLETELHRQDTGT